MEIKKLETLEERKNRLLENLLIDGARMNEISEYKMNRKLK